MSAVKERLREVYLADGEEAVLADPKLLAAVREDAEARALWAQLGGLDAALGDLSGAEMPPAAWERVRETIETIERPRLMRAARRTARRDVLLGLVGVAVAAGLVVVFGPLGRQVQKPAAALALMEVAPSPGGPPSKVSVQGLVNSFAYDDAAPRNGAAVAVHVEAAPCPWEQTRALVRVGIRGRDVGDALVARGAALVVTFDPERVADYRLVGEASGDWQVAQVARGQGTSALYEVLPKTTLASLSSGATSFIRVRLDYTDTSSNQAGAVEASASALAEPSRDLGFAAAVAMYGMGLEAPTSDLLDRAHALARAHVGMSAERAAFLRTIDEARAARGG